MVEYSLDYDTVFHALSDGSRRDMLLRVLRGDLTISELAQGYSMSFAGVAKHIEVLFKAQLVNKRRHGREQIVSANEEVIKKTTALLQEYEKIWIQRFDRLDEFLEKEE